MTSSHTSIDLAVNEYKQVIHNLYDALPSNVVNDYNEPVSLDDIFTAPNLTDKVIIQLINQRKQKLISFCQSRHV